MSPEEKPLVWLRGEIKTPPLSSKARIEAGVRLSLPHLRPMPALGARCHELRFVDVRASWRIMLRIDADAIIILDVFRKTTSQTPHHVLEACRDRLNRYDALMKGRFR